MNFVNFKLVTIICEPILVSSVIEITEEAGATGFTLTEVSGEGSGERRSGEIPEAKMKLEVVAEPGVASQIMTNVATRYFKNYALITYASDITVLRSEKF